jgi:hypothetical protein
MHRTDAKGVWHELVALQQNFFDGANAPPACPVHGDTSRAACRLDRSMDTDLPVNDTRSFC